MFGGREFPKQLMAITLGERNTVAVLFEKKQSPPSRCSITPQNYRRSPKKASPRRC